MSLLLVDLELSMRKMVEELAVMLLILEVFLSPLDLEIASLFPWE